MGLSQHGPVRRGSKRDGGSCVGALIRVIDSEIIARDDVLLLPLVIKAKIDAGPYLKQVEASAHRFVFAPAPAFLCGRI